MQLKFVILLFSLVAFASAKHLQGYGGAKADGYGGGKASAYGGAGAGVYGGAKADGYGGGKASAYGGAGAGVYGGAKADGYGGGKAGVYGGVNAAGYGKEVVDASLGRAPSSSFLKKRTDGYRYGRPWARSVIRARSQAGSPVSLYGRENRDYGIRG